MKHGNRAIKIKLSLHNKVHLKQKSIFVITLYVMCLLIKKQLKIVGKNTQQNISYRYKTCCKVCDNVIFKNSANDN